MKMIFWKQHIVHNKIDRKTLINAFNSDDKHRVAFYEFVVKKI